MGNTLSFTSNLPGEESASRPTGAAAWRCSRGALVCQRSGEEHHRPEERICHEAGKVSLRPLLCGPYGGRVPGEGSRG